MTEERIRHEIVKICHKVYEKGFVVATDGNVSVRLGEDRLLATPSGLCKGLVEANSIILTDMEGNKISGEGKPSSEIRMHLRAYYERDDIRAVVHSHPPISTAFSITMGSIPTTEYATPTTAEGPEVIKPYIKDYDAMILDRHGALTVGETLQKAYEKLEKLEHCAHITMMARQMGKVTVLSKEQVRKILNLRKKFGIVKRTPQLDNCSECGACVTDKQENVETSLNLAEVIAEEIKNVQREKLT